MKNKLYLCIALLGGALLLTACNVDTVSAAANKADAPIQEASVESSGEPAQTVSGQGGVLTQQAAAEANASSAVPDGYVQIFIDPQTGNLVTLDPATGQITPYTLPSTTKQDSTAQTNSIQTQANIQVNNSNQAQTAVQSNSNNQTRASAQAASASYIGESRALQIALDHAGVKSSDTLFSYAKLDYDDGRYEYDVEFYAGNKEYDYNIDAVTGNILSYDFDMESHYTPPVQQAAPAQPQPAAQPQTQAAASTAAVSIDTAKQTALSRVPGATASHIRITTDYDDGRMVYEGKIIYNAMEYDFEIDASTGNVTEWDVESIYD